MSSTSGDIAGAATRTKLKEVTKDSKLDATEYKELCATAAQDKSLDTGTREALKLLDPAKHGTNIQKDTGKGTIIDFVMGAVVTIAGKTQGNHKPGVFDALRNTIISQIEGGNSDRLTAEQEGLIDRMLEKNLDSKGQVAKDKLQSIVRFVLANPNFTKEDVRAKEIADNAPKNVDKKNAEQFQPFRNTIIAQIENGDRNKLSPNQERYLDSMLHESIGADGTVPKDKLQSITAFVLKNPNFTHQDMAAYNIAQQCPKNANIHNDESFQGLRNTLITILGFKKIPSPNGEELNKMLQAHADSNGNISPEAVQSVVAFIVKNPNLTPNDAKSYQVAASTPKQTDIKTDDKFQALRNTLITKLGEKGVTLTVPQQRALDEMLKNAANSEGIVSANSVQAVLAFVLKNVDSPESAKTIKWLTTDGHIENIRGSSDAWDITIDATEGGDRSKLSYNLAREYGGNGHEMNKDDIRRKAAKIQTLLGKITGYKTQITNQQLTHAIDMIKLGLDDNPEMYDKRALMGGVLQPVNKGGWAGGEVDNYSVGDVADRLFTTLNITNPDDQKVLRDRLMAAGGGDGDINQAQIFHTWQSLQSGNQSSTESPISSFGDKLYIPMAEPVKAQPIEAK